MNLYFKPGDVVRVKNTHEDFALQGERGVVRSYFSNERYYVELEEYGPVLIEEKDLEPVKLRFRDTSGRRVDVDMGGFQAQGILPAWIRRG